MQLIYTNEDDENFYFYGNYILSPNWSGFGESPRDIQTTVAPYQDGETYIDTKLKPKVLTIEFTIVGANRQEIFDRRKIVAAMFGDKRPGTLKWIQEDGSQYDIECIPMELEFPSGEGQGQTYQSVILQLYAPNPFWYDPTQVQEIMIGFSGGFKFPFKFPFNLGTVGTRKDVINSGSTETPIIIYLYGKVVSPVIKNETTLEEIKIDKTIEDGEVLIINTAFGEKSVLILTGGQYVNAFEYVSMTPDSGYTIEFFKLKKGINRLSYSTTEEGENAQCLITYFNRWGGL